MKRIALIGAGVVILLAVVLGYFLNSRTTLEDESVELKTKPCQLPAAPCVAESGSFSVAFSLPARIEYLELFEVQLDTTGWEKKAIEKVVVEFTMPGMAMGTNRFVLEETSTDKTSNRFKGNAVLPVCVSGRVDWIAHVRVITASEIYTANFPFSVTKQKE